jgi:hypothetical protein
LLATVVATLPGAASAKSTTCATTVVCAEYINTSSGVAIHGEANSGIGIRGTSVTNTGFYGASGSGNFMTPGVDGESTNATGQDAAGSFGLRGLLSGAAPAYGVLGYGSIYGVSGETVASGTSSSTTGYGVYGYDGSDGAFNAAIFGESVNGSGVIAESNATPNTALLGQFPIGLYAVADAEGNGAIGIEAESDETALEAHNTGGSYVELAGPGDLIYAGMGGGGSFVIDERGNEMLAGKLTTSQGTYLRKKGGSGTTRIAYGAQVTAPQIEDVGEGTLTNGRAVVAIDPALADTIDMRRPYHVFITPDGDCNQLYVAQKTPSGFVVRESHGGRSTLDFDYRIVAKPIDDDGARLAVAAPLPKISPLAGMHTGRTGHVTTLTAEQRLKARLGPQGYAKALAALLSRVTAR